MNHDADHVHLLETVPPSMSVGSAVRITKSNTSSLQKRKFAFHKEVYWGTDGIWSDGYFWRIFGVNTLYILILAVIYVVSLLSLMTSLPAGKVQINRGDLFILTLFENMMYIFCTAFHARIGAVMYREMVKEKGQAIPVLE